VRAARKDSSQKSDIRILLTESGSWILGKEESCISRR